MCDLYSEDAEGPVLQLILRISTLAALTFVLYISTEFMH